VGENEAPTASTTSLGLEWLRPKKLGVFSKISNRLIAFANPAFDAFIKNKFARDTSVALSDALLNGTGSDSKPKGLTQYKSGMTAVSMASAGRRFTVDDLAKMKQGLAVVDELRDTPTYGAIMRPEVKWGMLRERVLNYSGQTARSGQPILPKLLLSDSDIEAALRAKLGDTTQLLATENSSGVVTAGSTNSTVYFGDFSLAVFASFREPIFRVSDQAGDGSTGSAFLQDQLYMVMFHEVDFNILRQAAFAYMTGAETNEANW
jgi:hypothetical protein